MDPIRYRTERRTIDTPHGPAAYVDRGAGRPVMLLHGVATNALLWQPLMDCLGDDHRLIAPELPLHGGTPARPDQDLSLGGLARFVIGTADALGIENFDLVANDTGGAVAQVVAAEEPGRLRTLVLTNCDTQGNLPPEAFRPTFDLAVAGALAPAAPALLEDLESARSGVFGAGFERPQEALSPEAVEAFLGPVLGTPEAALQFERLIVTALDDEALRAVEERLGALTVPTLLVWGTDDVFFDLSWGQWLAKTIPGADGLVEVEGGRLFFPIERATELAAHLRAFWSRH